MASQNVVLRKYFDKVKGILMSKELTDVLKSESDPKRKFVTRIYMDTT